MRACVRKFVRGLWGLVRRLRDPDEGFVWELMRSLMTCGNGRLNNGGDDGGGGGDNKVVVVVVVKQQ